MHLTFIIGTRPEIIKTAPVIREARKRRMRVSVIHTGQHGVPEMRDVFFRQLRLRQPEITLRTLPPGTRSAFLRLVRGRVLRHLRRLKPDMVLVQGDTDSVLAGALAARDCGIPVGHIEAGLRSFDANSIEEKNRIRVDRISSMLFCPTAAALANLEGEKAVHGKLFLTGNPVADLAHQYRARFAAGSIMPLLGLTRKRYALLTAHRRETTGSEKNLAAVIKAAGRTGLRVLFPVHPRCLDSMEKYGLLGKLPPNLELLSPLPYLEFMGLARYARFIMTDSGGVQEEACLLRTPCITLREYTERPETVTLGANRLAGYSAIKIGKAVRDVLSGTLPRYRSPYGEGDAAHKIISAIKSSDKV